MSTDCEKMEAKVAKIQMAKTLMSTGQPPSRSVNAAPSSLPARQTIETKDSCAPTLSSNSAPIAASARTEVLMAGIITRPIWLISTAEKSSHEVASKAGIPRRSVCRAHLALREIVDAGT